MLKHLRRHAVAYLALFLAVGGGSAFAADTVFSTDIVDHEVKAVDLDANAVNSAKIAAGAVTGPKLAAGAVGTAAVADNALTGADIDESTLTLPKQPAEVIGGTADTSGGQVGGAVLTIPGYGRVRVTMCSIKTAAVEFVNDGDTAVDAASESTVPPDSYESMRYDRVAPGGVQPGTRTEGRNHVTWQISRAGKPGLATIEVMAIPNVTIRFGLKTCHFSAQATLSG